MSEPDVHWGGEVQLMGFGESDSSGAWIKLQITPEDLDHFRGLKGNTFEMLLANMVQSVSANKPKGGNFSKEAAKICKEVDFQRYSAEIYKYHYLKPAPATEDIARSLIYERCNVQSRAELDHNQDAKKRFIALMSRYRNWIANGRRLEDVI